MIKLGVIDFWNLAWSIISNVSNAYALILPQAMLCIFLCIAMFWYILVAFGLL